MYEDLLQFSAFLTTLAIEPEMESMEMTAMIIIIKMARIILWEPAPFSARVLTTVDIRIIGIKLKKKRLI